MDDTGGGGRGRTLGPVTHLCGLQLPLRERMDRRCYQPLASFRVKGRGQRGIGGVGRSNALPTAHPFQPLETSSRRDSHSPPLGLDSGGWRQGKEMALMCDGGGSPMLAVCSWRIYSLLLRLSFLTCKGWGRHLFHGVARGFNELISQIKTLPSYLAHSRCSINASRCSYATYQAMWGTFCIL